MPGGPPPKHPSERRRRNATVPMTQLPAKGRTGPAPKWPLSVPSGREKDLWRRVWKTPAAAAWERLGWHDQVARYVRILVRAEAPNAPFPALVEARNLEDRLGLNPVAMLRLRWEVSADELAERRDVPPAPARPRIIDSDALAGS